METILRDVKYGFRTLIRAPLFTATMALMLGGALGVLCAVFSLFNAYALRPFCDRQPGECVRLHVDFAGESPTPVYVE
jgi:succinate-acetate transporter protein